MPAESNMLAGLEYIMYIMAWLESWILEAGLGDELEVLQSCIRGCSRGSFLSYSEASPKNTRKMRK
jgi:hypothetical protein